MHLFSYSQTIIAGGACSVASFGFWVWLKNSKSSANILIGIMALFFAFWTTVEWVNSLHLQSPYHVITWSLLYLLTLSFAPAICFHASLKIAQFSSFYRIRLIYTLSTLTAALLIFAWCIDYFTDFSFTGVYLLKIASLSSLIIYLLTLIFILRNHCPTFIQCKRNARHDFPSLILFLLFILAGMMQLVFGPMISQPYVAGASFTFFIIAVSTSIRTGFLGVKVYPLEGFFLALIGASAVLLFHAQDIIEFTISFVAVIVIGLYGRTAIVLVSKERAKAQEMAVLNRQLRELDQARNDFTAMVAHQLRGPIGGIRVSASTIADGSYGKLPARAKQAVQLLENSAQRLLSLAEVYMQGIKLNQGSLKSFMEKVNIESMIKDIVHDLSALADIKSIKIIQNINLTNKYYLIDKIALSNSLFNLLDNAIKYTEKGRITITASYSRHTLKISVSDTGLGMDAQELKASFKPYIRGKSSRKQQKEGTGLGLYIVKKLSNHAGGNIKAFSSGKGRGSEFILLLPCKPVDEHTTGV